MNTLKKYVTELLRRGGLLDLNSCFTEKKSVQPDFIYVTVKSLLRQAKKIGHNQFKC